MLPNKRIKLDTADSQKNDIIISEIDIELGLRKRLAQTLESRIAWASLLLQSLQSEAEYSNQVPFKDVALSTLSALESPSDILFARDIPLPPQSVASKGRLPPKEKPITRSQKSKFLYLRSQDSSQIFFLRCCICNQSTFSSLQGLYNHARLLHDKEWGSHEECVKSCAVLQQDPDAELDLEAGVDVGRGMMLPGVKSLFQMAVEGTRDEHPTPEANEGGEVVERSVLLTKTLGLHSDSPALAQFLGKEAKRKGIKVWDDSTPIDIDSLDNAPSVAKLRWKKHRMYRSNPKFDEQVVTNEQGSRVAAAGPSSAGPSSIIASSRFHISCRVTVADSSLFIPEGCNSKNSVTILHL
ncbi:hypothetical protein GYMLUDRAFT_162417 [Collybiopsis luxurians FD-317 M1]|uniref:AHC1-like C2H2 zinc-finger domain-containing protein n=1 Tax=Collybiopsis luxurians FD-317 M1 TaxID=944289 RepID=A0A0D0C6P4_9AGAR|nr:hypothetical protein GYMLUDRAFT_162417 [Collybiopsis luxurians FD-317 M1]